MADDKRAFIGSANLTMAGWSSGREGNVELLAELRTSREVQQLRVALDKWTANQEWQSIDEWIEALAETKVRRWWKDTGSRQGRQHRQNPCAAAGTRIAKQKEPGQDRTFSEAAPKGFDGRLGAYVTSADQEIFECFVKELRRLFSGRIGFVHAESGGRCFKVLREGEAATGESDERLKGRLNICVARVTHNQVRIEVFCDAQSQHAKRYWADDVNHVREHVARFATLGNSPPGKCKRYGFEILRRKGNIKDLRPSLAKAKTTARSVYEIAKMRGNVPSV